MDGSLAQAVGPVAPGTSQTVTLTTGLATRENQSFAIDVRSGGEVIASKVVTIDCAPPPPGVEILAELACSGADALGTATVTNNGQETVTFTVTVEGESFGDPLVVAPGTTATASASFSQFEDRTITVQTFINGELLATYTPTPDCDQSAVPAFRVAGLECPPPSATATLSNEGDAHSSVVFTILVDGRVAQETAPLYGGDTTTIVGDLTPFEDQRITIELLANGQVLGSRTLDVNCQQNPGPGPGPGPGQGTGPRMDPGVTGPGPAQTLPATGAPFGAGLVAIGLGLVLSGAALVVAGRRGRYSS